MENEPLMQVSVWVLLFGSLKPILLQLAKNKVNLLANLDPKKKVYLVAFVAVSSALLGILSAGLDGQVTTDLLESSGHSFVNFLAVFGISELVYQRVVKPATKHFFPEKK